MDQRFSARRPTAPSIHSTGKAQVKPTHAMHPVAPAHRPPVTATNRPAPPPVYRPVARGVQAKPAPGVLPATNPVSRVEHRPAPPVYRPVSLGVQAKSARGVPPATPTAPPIYRPRPQQVGMRMVAAPPVPLAYRPTAQSLQPTVASFAPQQPRLEPPAVYRPQVRAMQPRIAAPSGKRPAVLQLKEMKELIEYLGRSDYGRDRNYMTWKGGPKSLPHVGWKAHIAGTAATARDIVRIACGFLRAKGVGHKVDIDDVVFSGSQKFITIYADNEDVFQEIIPTLEGLLSPVGITRHTVIESDMPVGDQGLVWMRHGQNTPLTLKMVAAVKGLGVNQGETQGQYTKWTGSDVTFAGEWRYLWSDNNRGLFFFTRENNVPQSPNSETVAMAILHAGKILPDQRNHPNPANAPLPSGVKQWAPEPEPLPIEPGGPPETSPLGLAMRDNGDRW